LRRAPTKFGHTRERHRQNLGVLLARVVRHYGFTWVLSRRATRLLSSARLTYSWTHRRSPAPGAHNLLGGRGPSGTLNDSSMARRQLKRGVVVIRFDSCIDHGSGSSTPEATKATFAPRGRWGMSASQHEGAKVIRCERHVPALSGLLRSAHRHDARVVEQPDNRQMECDDLRGRAPHAGDTCTDIRK
jgi:hypothetical protein